MSRIQVRQFALAGLLALGMAGGARGAGDPASCKSVHFSDVGWSCITATTAIASNVLEGLGYTPKASVLSVPITFESLSNGDIDEFRPGPRQAPADGDRREGPRITLHGVAQRAASLDRHSHAIEQVAISLARPIGSQRLQEKLDIET